MPTMHNRRRRGDPDFEDTWPVDPAESATEVGHTDQPPCVGHGAWLIVAFFIGLALAAWAFFTGIAP